MNIVNLNDLSSSNIGRSCQIKTGTYNHVYYNSNPGNCKLCTIDNLGSILNNGNSGIDILKKILKIGNKLVFNVNLTHIGLVNILRKHFKEVYVKEVPIGYGTGFQYHCCFLTENAGYSGFTEYINRIEKLKFEESKKQEFEESELILKNVPIIDNKKQLSIDDIKSLSIEDIIKIQNYKQPKRITDLLNKKLKK